MTAPDPRLEEIEGRLNKATPGPWAIEYDEYGDDGEVIRYPIGVGPFTGDFDNLGQGARADADAEFIAAAPADVAYLLAELRKAQGKLARVEGLCGSWQEMATTTNAADTTLRAAVYAIRAAVADATGGGE